MVLNLFILGKKEMHRGGQDCLSAFNPKLYSILSNE